MEVTLPHDVVEDILERLPVEILVRLKCVCSTWRSTIDSQTFQGETYDSWTVTRRSRYPPSRGVGILAIYPTTPVSFKTQPIPGKANFFKVTQS
ncbi:unnamed protein product, partial [Arabidopsis halleri]